MTDLSAVSSGDYLAALEATRDAIVADLGACESMPVSYTHLTLPTICSV